MPFELRFRYKAAFLAAFSLSVTAGSALPAVAEDTFNIPRAGVEFLTGDSWTQGGKTIRLYGVQSCLRGKTYTDQRGKPQDCGIVSSAVLAAIVRDTNPVCRAVASLSFAAPTRLSAVLTICSVRLGGQTLDLGNIMISQGFAFAALANDGKPVYMLYQLQESVARQSRSGLWAFSDVPVPSLDLLASPERRPRGK